MTIIFSSFYAFEIWLKCNLRHACYSFVTSYMTCFFTINVCNISTVQFPAIYYVIFSNIISFKHVFKKFKTFIINRNSVFILLYFKM